MVGTHSRMSLMGGSPFRMSERGQETLPNVQKWWAALLDDREASRMSGSGLEALPDGREWLGGSHGYPGVVGRPFQMSGSCRDALRMSESCQKALSKSLRPSRLSGYGRETFLDVPEWWEALPDVQKWSGDPPVCPGLVERPFRMSGSGRETLP